MLEDETAIHVAFAEMPVGIERDAARRGVVLDDDPHRHAGAVAIGVGQACGVGDKKRTGPYDAFQRPVKQRIHRILSTMPDRNHIPAGV